LRPPNQSPESFRPRRGLGSGHAQTIAAVVLRRRIRLPAPEARLFRMDDGAQVLCHLHWQPVPAWALTLLIVHGLEGSSESNYVLGITEKALARGHNVVRMNVRNCGGTEKLAPTLYHSGLSSDVGAVLRTLLTGDGLPRIGLVGYSMGGNQVLKLAGELGPGAPPQLVGVAAVCPSVDLGPSADALHLPHNRLYEWMFVWELRQRLRRKAKLFPEIYAGDLQRVQGAWSIREFDDRITAPHGGFRDAVDYYDRASAARVVERIAVPSLVVCAGDDPFIRILPATRATMLSNPSIRLLETEHGGHCGYIAAADGYDGRWAERQVVAFFDGR
jgi:uncharacterized protein